MSEKKAFWQFNNMALLAIYAAALVLLLSGQGGHLIVLLAGLILAAHVLEIPYAWYVLRDKDGSRLRQAAGTLLFGFTWWLPAKKGIYGA